MSDTGGLEPIYTVDDVAKYLGCTRGTVRNFIRRGKLHAIRVGGVRLIRVTGSALRDFVDLSDEVQLGVTRPRS